MADRVGAHSAIFRSMLLFAALAGAAVADLPLVIVGKGNPKAKAKDPSCVSWWGPNIITTNSNNTPRAALGELQDQHARDLHVPGALVVGRQDVERA